MKIEHNLLFILLFSLLVACGGSKHFIEGEDPEPKKQVVQSTDRLLQEKYAAELNVEPEDIKDIEVYRFIDKWIGTPYVLGGESEKGIDCSSFAQHFYNSVYDHLIERTAHKQYKAKSTSRFIGQEFLKEGDLLFFKSLNSKDDKITHVGIYLMNNKFISATSYRGPSKKNGVKISDLKLPYWQKKFVSAGRKRISKYTKKHKKEKAPKQELEQSSEQESTQPKKQKFEKLKKIKKPKKFKKPKVKKPKIKKLKIN